MHYNWQQKDWPNFQYQTEPIEDLLFDFAQRTGRISGIIEGNKKAYYDALQKAQRSNEITDWINYFVQTVLDAQIDAEQEIEFTLKKTKFFDNYKNALNERQQKVVRRMLEEGHHGFKEGMNARKYVSIASTSKATPTRDLQDLVQKGIFKPIGGGRSTSYELKL